MLLELVVFRNSFVVFNLYDFRNIMAVMIGYLINTSIKIINDIVADC